ncbi:hypothetical protein HH214_03480 [Mucilaginibacter robiniae]|uniref:Uncharacterized protein n=1 Tax=Mucilaginibacter robiniae TaxID=2728022 RepID=A0A7L5DY23_9SPHI|nr:hypothetical protein [Mucilaginibacter robiniae]QJD95007.1 hypothetical protein HH214_03480 [Mucilaginibacter robiniae]
MYRKDLIADEAQKFAQLIAKLLGLKNTNPDEAKQLYQQSLSAEFGLDENTLLQLSNADFGALLEQRNYNAQKLDGLAQMLYLEAEPFTADQATLTTLQKVLIIFDRLEQHYHVQSFENISRRNQINQYLKQQHA